MVTVPKRRAESANVRADVKLIVNLLDLGFIKSTLSSHLGRRYLKKKAVQMTCPRCLYHPLC